MCSFHVPDVVSSPMMLVSCLVPLELVCTAIGVLHVWNCERILSSYGGMPYSSHGVTNVETSQVQLQSNSYTLKVS